MPPYEPDDWHEDQSAESYDADVQPAHDNEFFSEPPFRLVGETAAAFLRMNYGIVSTSEETTEVDRDNDSSATWPEAQ